MLCLDFIILF